jgi:1-acyl-sn-glycerol-3-phosphate acyltransferase
MNQGEGSVPMILARPAVSEPGAASGVAAPPPPSRSGAPPRRTSPASMKSDFRPPRDNPFLIRVMQRLTPLIARLWRRIVAISIPEADLARLRALNKSRFLLCANHPTLGDPLIIAELSRRLGVTFNYMAARDLFLPIFGAFLQRLGTYSVQRGTPDREAMRTTRRLLAQEDRKVVVFPEGLTHEHNDLLLPFHAGVIQIGFWVLEDLEKLGKEVRLPVVPVAIKYLIQGDARPALSARLARLERALQLSPGADQDLYSRLRAVGERVLMQMEREFGLSPAPAAPLAERIAAAKAHVLERVARILEVRLSPDAPASEQLQILDNALAAYVAEYADSAVDYERRLHRRRREVAGPLARDLSRLHNFLAVSDGYVAAAMTAERFQEVLGRLEAEVFGRPARRLPTRAELRVGEPLDLGDFYADYPQNKRAAVTAANTALQRRLQALLQPLSELGTPLAG